MNQDGDLVLGEATQDQYRGRFAVTVIFTNTTDVKIKDMATVTSSLVVNQNITIGDVNVKVNLQHTWVNDLRLTLISPTGIRVMLKQSSTPPGQDMTNTVFDDEAATAISAAAAPFTGSFRPEVPLSGLDGLNAKGTWKLEISDMVKFYSGTLSDWSLIFGQPDSGTTSPQSLAENGPAEVVKSGPAPGASPSRDAAAANVGAGPAEVMKSGPAPGASPSRDAMLALVGAMDVAPFLLGKPAREQVPPSNRVADQPRFASPVSFDSVPVQGKARWQTPTGAGGRSGTAHAVDSLFECFEQMDEWLGERVTRLL
jgi:serine protease